MTAPTELLPCPFCGAKGQTREVRIDSWIGCLECNARGPDHAFINEAIAAWNRRTAPISVSDVSDETIKSMLRAFYQHDEDGEPRKNCMRAALAVFVGGGK